jgi:hypothetical protein
MRLHLPLLLMFASWIAGRDAAIPTPAQPVATLEASQLLPRRPAEHISAAVTFVSDTSLAVGVCSGPRTCSLSLVRWEHGALSRVATTLDFGWALTDLHRGPEDSVLAINVPRTAFLYSADLSSRREVQPGNAVSSSGRITAQWVRGGWSLHRVDQVLPIRSGKGSLRSVSDEVVVFQDGDVMRIETIGGAAVSSFAVRPESKCPTLAEVLAGDRLYVEDCKEHRIVDFNGKTKLKLRKPRGWSANSSELDRSSADGNRLLFDSWSRKVSFWRNAGEIAVAFATLGMGVGDQEDNREEVRVVDATSGAICFDLQRRFPMGAVSFYNHGAISPSGQFVAIVADGELSIYQIPPDCGTGK